MRRCPSGGATGGKPEAGALKAGFRGEPGTGRQGHGRRPGPQDPGKRADAGEGGRREAPGFRQAPRNLRGLTGRGVAGAFGTVSGPGTCSAPCKNRAPEQEALPRP